jgi:hypothetical protein
MTIRRIMQVEITPYPDTEELCRVVLRDPHTGTAMVCLSGESTEFWTRSMQ